MLRVSNSTHYFNEYSKVFNIVPDNSSFQYESSKRLGYYQRLYFEFEYTKKVNGECYFYTFTYNDNSIPKFLGMNVFDYNHIRLITNGVISKELIRKYGSRLRYFCVCESGEGKGVRGLGNNPHYHIIFFVQPLHDSNNQPIFDNYKKIDAFSFRSLCQRVWQGSDKPVYWKTARFGHVQEGNFCGIVYNTDCFSYVGKYILKDDCELSVLDKVRSYYYAVAFKEHYNFRTLYAYYRYLKYTLFESVSKYSFWNMFQLDKFCNLRRLNKRRDYSLKDFFTDYASYYGIQGLILHKFNSWFTDVYIDIFVTQRLSEFNNRFGGKVRCSKGLGEYGLNFIIDSDTNPHFEIPSHSKENDVQYPSLYYIRKLYYDYKICPVSGSPLYFLNSKGVSLKLYRLESNIQSFCSRFRESVSKVFLNDLKLSFFKDANYLISDFSVVNCDSFVVKDVSNTEKELLRFVLNSPDLTSILYKYAVYHFVYQYRSWNKSTPLKLSSDFLLSDIKEDYSLFLKYNISCIDYSYSSLCDLHYRPDCVSFSSHPLFEPYIKLFDFFDYVLSVVSDFDSDFSKRKFKERSEFIKRFNASMYNSQEFYPVVV